MVISTLKSATCLQFRVTVRIYWRPLRHPSRIHISNISVDDDLSEHYTNREKVLDSVGETNIVFQIWHLTKILLAERTKFSQTIYTVWISLADVFVQIVSLHHTNVPFPLRSLILRLLYIVKGPCTAINVFKTQQNVALQCADTWCNNLIKGVNCLI